MANYWFALEFWLKIQNVFRFFNYSLCKMRRLKPIYFIYAYILFKAWNRNKMPKYPLNN